MAVLFDGVLLRMRLKFNNVIIALRCDASRVEKMVLWRRFSGDSLEWVFRRS
jgi:hypothetical protein